jgi:thiol-disulfide isomerase/thioredoxin
VRILGTLGFAALLGLSACRKDASDTDAAGPLTGKPEPQWTLSTVDGRGISSRDFAGKAHLVVFWATWCGPCRMEIDELKALRGQFPRNFEVVGLSVDESVGAVPQTIQQAGIDYPVAVGASPLFDSLHFDGIPRSYLVDAKGTVREEFDGLVDRGQLAAAVARVLKE